MLPSSEPAEIYLPPAPGWDPDAPEIRGTYGSHGSMNPTAGDELDRRREENDRR